MKRILSTALGTALLLLTGAACAQEQPAALPSADLLSYTRIYADAAGASHFADENMSFTLTSPRPGIPPTPAAAPTPATGLRFFCPPAGAFADWHPAPRRQFNFIVAGTVEVEVSDGAVRRFEPGSVLLLEDTEGQGHRTRVVGDAHGCFAAVPLAAE